MNPDRTYMAAIALIAALLTVAGVLLLMWVSKAYGGALK